MYVVFGNKGWHLFILGYSSPWTRCCLQAPGHWMMNTVTTGMLLFIHGTVDDSGVE